MGTTGPRRIVIVGGGFVGLFNARRLQRRLRREAALLFVTPRNFMTYQPFLAEAAVGSLEPRHVVVPLRRPTDLQWTLVELTGHILHDVGEKVGQRATEELRGRVLRNSDLPLDDTGRVQVATDLHVDATQGVGRRSLSRRTRSHELRSDDTTDRAIMQFVRRDTSPTTSSPCCTASPHDLRPSVHRLRRKRRAPHGGRRVYGVQLRGTPASALHRKYHLAQMPTLKPQGADRAGLGTGLTLSPRPRLVRRRARNRPSPPKHGREPRDHATAAVAVAR
jgi:hypothetical protein